MAAPLQATQIVLHIAVYKAVTSRSSYSGNQ